MTAMRRDVVIVIGPLTNDRAEVFFVFFKYCYFFFFTTRQLDGN